MHEAQGFIHLVCTQNFGKNNISYSLIRSVRLRIGVRNISPLEIFAYVLILTFVGRPCRDSLVGGRLVNFENTVFSEERNAMQKEFFLHFVVFFIKYSYFPFKRK